jgi:hypothetical protein
MSWWVPHRLGAVLSSEAFETLTSVVGECRASVDAGCSVHARLVLLTRIKEAALGTTHAFIALASGKRKKKVTAIPQRQERFFSLVGSSRVDASSLTATRDVLLEALVDVDLADFPNETSSSAVALVISEQVRAGSIVLAWNRVALVYVDLAVASSISGWALANRSGDVREASSAVLARLGNAVSVVAESSLIAFAAIAGEVVAGRRVWKEKADKKLANIWKTSSSTH